MALLFSVSGFLLNCYVANYDINVTLQPAFIYLNSTEETLDAGVLNI